MRLLSAFGAAFSPSCAPASSRPKPTLGQASITGVRQQPLRSERSPRGVNIPLAGDATRLWKGDAATAPYQLDDLAAIVVWESADENPLDMDTSRLNN